MKEIPLNKTKVALVDDEDFIWLSEKKWSYHGPYVSRKQSNKTILLHREILKVSQGLEVDHINGNPLDNRKENLRIATHQQNLFNSKISKNNKSGYKGVCWQRGKWQASIKVKGKQKYLGVYKDKKIAALAYNIASIGFYGKFANKNNLSH